MIDRSKLYTNLAKPLLFSFDAEFAHHLTLSVGKLSRVEVVTSFLRSLFPVSQHSGCIQSGIAFKNRLGVAAGLDKEGVALDLFAALGFGHIEVGTITPRAQPGNPKPRIFRLPEDSALINRMGFPSSGMHVARQNIESFRSRRKSPPILGANIGKCKDTPIDNAAYDYLDSFNELAPVVDYVVVNVSSPNTPELRRLQDRDKLELILRTLQDANRFSRPIFVKVAPDLTEPQLEDLLACCNENGIRGIIGTNTTISREGIRTVINETGGLSGAPLTSRSKEVVRYIRSHVSADTTVIGCGGIMNGQDAVAMRSEGADLLQIYTGLVYRGPTLVKEILDAIEGFGTQRQ